MLLEEVVSLEGVFLHPWHDVDIGSDKKYDNDDNNMSNGNNNDTLQL